MSTTDGKTIDERVADLERMVSSRLQQIEARLAVAEAKGAAATNRVETLGGMVAKLDPSIKLPPDPAQQRGPAPAPAPVLRKPRASR